MSPSALEAFLVLIYANSAARARFKADPYDEAKRAGFSDNEVAANDKHPINQTKIKCRRFFLIRTPKLNRLTVHK